MAKAQKTKEIEKPQLSINPAPPILLDITAVPEQIQGFFNQLMPLMEQLNLMMPAQQIKIAPEKKENPKLDLDVNENFTTQYFEIWQQMYKNMQNLTQSFPMNGITPLGKREEDLPITIFDPQIMGQTFLEALEKILHKPQNLEDITKKYMDQLSAIVSHLKNRLDGGPWEAVVEASFGDRRFQDILWKSDPWANFLKQLYLATSKYLENCVERIEDLPPRSAQKLKFYTRQITDALSPSNVPFLNPVVIDETKKTGGKNLYKGWLNYLSDLQKSDGQFNISMTDMKAFKVGENLATTPGKVVFQNELFQLIQYEPLTEKVAQIPLLIIPPWINKYYIFDLKAENSFVRWALESGFTVFIMSWVNPNDKTPVFTLSDYVTKGALTALEVVRNITKEPKANLIGYCSGGILMHCMLSYLSQTKKDWVQSATAMATPGDTSMAGELLVYICEQQLERLEKHITKKGFLDGQAMVTSFNLLRANDLIWSFYINNYLLGKDPFPFDLLYWNCDASNMPVMHSEYLKKIFFENSLIKYGGLNVDDVPVDLGKINVPMFVVAAIEDHIVPWKSVYPITHLYEGPSKFVLSASGHVAGMMNHPARNKYHYWVNENKNLNPDCWVEQANKVGGSWWTEWKKWIEPFNGPKIDARKIDEKIVLENTPGSYVID